MKTFLKIAGIVVGVFVLVVVLLIVIGSSANKSIEKIAENTVISIKTAEVEKNSTVTFAIENISEEAQKLVSIDIDNDILDNANLINTEPGYVSEFVSGSDTVYEIKKEILPKESYSITFSYLKKTPEVNTIPVDICINGMRNCVTKSFSI